MVHSRDLHLDPSMLAKVRGAAQTVFEEARETRPPDDAYLIALSTAVVEALGQNEVAAIRERLVAAERSGQVEPRILEAVKPPALAPVVAATLVRVADAIGVNEPQNVVAAFNAATGRGGFAGVTPAAKRFLPVLLQAAFVALHDAQLGLDRFDGSGDWSRLPPTGDQAWKQLVAQLPVE